MEDTFTFNKTTKGIIGDKDEIQYTLKESELDQKHLDLLLGELMKTWNNSPVKVQIKFMKTFMDAFIEKRLVK